MLKMKKPAPEMSAAIPWLAWIERTLGTRVQLVCWSSGAGLGRPDRIAEPVVLGTPRLTWTAELAAAATDFCRSRPPEAISAGTSHLVGQALRYRLGGVPALVRVGSQTHPLGIILVGARSCAFTAEELGLMSVAAQRIAEAIARDALQEIIQDEARQRLRAVYERDALIDFSRGLPRARTEEEVYRHLLFFALGLTTALGGYVAIGKGELEPKIAAVRGHVLVARPAAVAEAMREGRPVPTAGGVIVPFRTNTLSGYLVLGGRLSGDDFGPDDTPELEAACSQAAMALELYSMTAR